MPLRFKKKKNLNASKNEISLHAELKNKILTSVLNIQTKSLAQFLYGQDRFLKKLHTAAA